MTDGSSPTPPSAPSKSSEALRLRSLGLTNKQVAAVLDVPVASARRLVSEGRRAHRAASPENAYRERTLPSLRGRLTKEEKAMCAVIAEGALGVPYDQALEWLGEKPSGGGFHCHCELHRPRHSDMRVGCDNEQPWDGLPCKPSGGNPSPAREGGDGPPVFLSGDGRPLCPNHDWSSMCADCLPAWAMAPLGTFEPALPRMNDGYGGISFRKRGQAYPIELGNRGGASLPKGAERPPSSKPTHLIVPDTQCKPGVPLDHMLWAGKYIAERKPDVVIHLGDHYDMPSLSSYEGRGTRTMEGQRYKADIEAGNHGLALLSEGMGSFRPKRMILLRGNHEDRIERAVNEDPRLEGVIGYHDFNDLELGWEVVPFLTPITVDGVTYCHFFAQPMSGRPYSGAIDTMIKNIGFTFTAGHSQGLRWGRRELTNGGVQLGLVAGSFYQHNEDYKGNQGNHHWRGLVVKHEVADGDYDPMFVSLGYLSSRFGR